MAKGIRKKSRSHFKSGHEPYRTVPDEQKPDSGPPKKYVRLDPQSFDSNVRVQSSPGKASTISLVDADMESCPVGVLRRGTAGTTLLDRYRVSEDKQQEVDTYRMLHLGKTADLWNTAFQEHTAENPGCNGNLQWDMENEEKWGICFVEGLKCIKCDYRSKPVKLYKEVNTGKRGRKPGATNYRVQVGLSHTSIGNKEFSQILNAMDMPSPSSKSMQKNSNDIMDKLTSHNKQEMSDLVKGLKKMASLKGQPTNSPINVEMDCRYNNPLYSGAGKTPYQPATQVTLTAVENSTTDKKIIDVTVKSKLCKKGREEQKKHGDNVQCPNHAGKCTASLQQYESIGDEGRWARESLLKLCDQGLEVKYLTTDADSSLYAAAKDLHDSGKTKNEPLHQLDTRHLSNSQKRKVKNTQFSHSMFCGRTAEMRKQKQSRFADDLAARCHAEHCAAKKELGSREELLIRNLSFTVDAIIGCYQSDHSMCRSNSYVCKGVRGDNWLKHSCYLPSGFSIDCTLPQDEAKLRDCVNFRLGKDCLKKTKHLFNTQKCEAVNRALSKSVPKNKTFSRNFEGRIHSAVHAVNSGLATSVIKQCEYVGTPLCKGSKAVQCLAARQKSDVKRLKNQKTAKSRNARILRKRQLFKMHEKTKQDNVNLYEKNVLKPLFEKETVPAFLVHHNYYNLRKKKS